MSLWVAVILTVLVTVALLWAFFTAQRLNSLHIRTDAALASLEAALNRRAAVVAALLPDEEQAQRVAQRVESTPLDPGGFAPRAQRESALNDVVGRRLDPPPAQLVDAEVRVQLAQRFYNEAVADTRALRLRPLVKLARLGGTARLPQFCDYTLAAAPDSSDGGK